MTRGLSQSIKSEIVSIRDATGSAYRVIASQLSEKYGLSLTGGQVRQVYHREKQKEVPELSSEDLENIAKDDSLYKLWFDELEGVKSRTKGKQENNFLKALDMQRSLFEARKRFENLQTETGTVNNAFYDEFYDQVFTWLAKNLDYDVLNLFQAVVAVSEYRLKKKYDITFNPKKNQPQILWSFHDSLEKLSGKISLDPLIIKTYTSFWSAELN